MRPERKLLSVLKSTTSDQRYESVSWFVYNLFGSTLPIWLGGYLLLPIFGKRFDWIEYSSHGELALYSAAFLAPTLRIIGRDIEDSIFVRRQTFLFLGWIFLTAAVALYSGVISAAGMPSAAKVNTRLLFGVSVCLFAFSVVFSSLVRLIDYQRIQPKQIFATQQASEIRLEEEFDKTAPQHNEIAGEKIQETINQSPAGESQDSETTVEWHETPGNDSTDDGADDGTK